ncbi:unnamed protein product, partial [Porites lobata]
MYTLEEFACIDTVLQDLRSRIFSKTLIVKYSGERPPKPPNLSPIAKDVSRNILNREERVQTFVFANY